MPPDMRTPRGGGTGGALSSAIIGQTVGENIVPRRRDTVAFWVERIRPHLVQAVQSILDAGTELNNAKAAVGHGQFGPLLKEIGISWSMADLYMAVAKNHVIAKFASVGNLPAAVSVLAELARLDDDDLEQALTDGTVSSSTTRRQATQMVADRRQHPDVDRLRDENQMYVDGAVVHVMDNSTMPALTFSERIRMATNFVTAVTALDELINTSPSPLQTRDHVRDLAGLYAYAWSLRDTPRSLDEVLPHLAAIAGERITAYEYWWVAVTWISFLPNPSIDKPFAEQLQVLCPGDDLLESAYTWFFTDDEVTA